MQALSTALIFLVSLVNLLPLGGVVSADRLASLYGVVLDDPNLVILMRHRAVLFGIVGGLLMVSAFHPPLRPVGIAAGLISMLSFVVIAWLVGGYNGQLGRVVLVDLVATVVLLAAVLLDHLAGRAPSGG